MCVRLRDAQTGIAHLPGKGDHWHSLESCIHYVTGQINGCQHRGTYLDALSANSMRLAPSVGKDAAMAHSSMQTRLYRTSLMSYGLC